MHLFYSYLLAIKLIVFVLHLQEWDISHLKKKKKVTSEKNRNQFKGKNMYKICIYQILNLQNPQVPYQYNGI